ncbi:MAG: hypothetical protein ACYDCN_13530 [Bacteroidia bacterium]
MKKVIKQPIHLSPTLSKGIAQHSAKPLKDKNDELKGVALPSPSLPLPTSPKGRRNTSPFLTHLPSSQREETPFPLGREKGMGGGFRMGRKGLVALILTALFLLPFGKAGMGYAQSTDEVTKLRNDVKTLQMRHATHEKLRNAHQTTIDSLKEVVRKLQTGYEIEQGEIAIDDRELSTEMSKLNQLDDYVLHKFMRYHSILKRTMVVGLLAFVFCCIVLMILYIVIRSHHDQAERNFAINSNALLKATGDLLYKFNQTNDTVNTKLNELNKLFLNESRDIKDSYRTLVDKTKMQLTTNIAESYIKAISQCTEMDKTTSKHLTLLKEQIDEIRDEFISLNKRIIALEKSKEK